MLAGAVVFTVIAIIVIVAVYGVKTVMNMSGGGVVPIEVLRILQIFTATGVFVVPALVFSKIETNSWIAYLKLHGFPILLAVLAIITLVVASPLLELSALLNKSLKLPGFLRNVEVWMFLKEQEAAEMVKQLLRMDTISVLVINILMLAIIPAVGEEFIFRGCFQKIFRKWTGNKHVAIWITAIIFSAIHVQFYGFLPRMLLGALFGYLLIWSGTIWISVLAHFVNNCVVVITAYIYQRQGISLDKLDQPDPVAFYVYIISFLVFSALLWTFYTTSLKYGVSLSKRTDGSRLD
jgi:membrane protease YdiL (CAAX protease family)